MLLPNARLSDCQRDVTQRLLPATTQTTKEKTEPKECNRALHLLDCAPAPGWTAHASHNGRLYYCNHITKTAGWLPPFECWKTREQTLPYGWERAVDDSGRTYYINHINKTTTYEPPAFKSLQPLLKPKPRTITLERSSSLGFGFVAGSEKPVVVRFVTEGGPSAEKLLPGDQILSVNGEDVKTAPREHVISLIRSCAKSVTLEVCQPAEQQGVRKSTLLSAAKRARLKCKPYRVRFAESVCVNGAPLFPPSALTLGDICVPQMANVLKVFLENAQTKSFKYDAWTTVQDVINSLQSKLCIRAIEHFSLVVEHIKSLRRNKLTILDPRDSIAKIASQPGAHKLRCLFRATFVPIEAADLAQRDLNALEYLYNQCCNDVIQERFLPELQCETALRLAALHICQHALDNNVQTCKLTMKIVERQFGLERFVPASILESIKRKEIRKIVGHFIKLHANMAGSGKQLTALQIKLHYLDIASQLPSYGAKCFSSGLKADAVESVILVSPKFGISEITGHPNSVFQPVPVANLEDLKKIEVKIQDEITQIVYVMLQNDKILQIYLEKQDAAELVLVLRGYFKLITGQDLLVYQEKTPSVEDAAPPYLAEHKVVPEKWSYIEQSAIKTVSFTMSPLYQGVSRKTNGLYNTVGRHSKPTLLIDYSFDSNMNKPLSNRNRPFLNENNLEMENVNTISEKQLRLMHKVHEKNNCDQHSTEEQNLSMLNTFAEWQETSVDIDSDSDEPGPLKHSDSLTLLNKIHNDDNSSACNATLDLLSLDSLQSESDNDSLYAVSNSPNHKKKENELNMRNRLSFGLRSPNTSANKYKDFQELLQQICYLDPTATNTFESIDDVFVFDTDIIDLTFIPPPSTPDKLDSALPTPINVPPVSFADSIDSHNKIDLNENQELEEFLASVSIPAPTQKVTPATELTPEEIMAYIIPPPPSSIKIENVIEEEPEQHFNKSVKEKIAKFSEMANIMGENLVTRKNRIEQPNKNDESDKITRLEAVECNNGNIIRPVLPLPRRSACEKPPDRPPKEFTKDRKRLHSEEQKSNSTTDLPVPKLPPRIGASPQAPQRLSLLPKKLELVLLSASGSLNSYQKLPTNKSAEYIEKERVSKGSAPTISTVTTSCVAETVKTEKQENVKEM